MVKEMDHLKAINSQFSKFQEQIKYPRMKNILATQESPSSQKRPELLQEDFSPKGQKSFCSSPTSGIHPMVLNAVFPVIQLAIILSIKYLEQPY